MKLKTTVEIEIECECDYIPGRPAPACSNPSSPLYSDCGDDEELEIIDMHVIDNKKKIKIPVDICDIICDSNIDKLLDEARELFQDDYVFSLAEKSQRDEVDDYR